MADSGSESRRKQIAKLEGHFDVVSSVCWSPDGACVASASDDSTIRAWDTVSGECIAVLEGHTDVVSSISWSPDGSRLVSASVDGTVRVWRIQGEIGLSRPSTGRIGLRRPGET